MTTLPKDKHALVIKGSEPIELKNLTNPKK